MFFSLVHTFLSFQGNYDTTDVAFNSNSLKRTSPRNQNAVNYDPKIYFFSKFGSSFNQFPQLKINDPNDKKPNIIFPHSHLQTILSLSKKLLTKNMLHLLDEQALEIYIAGKILIFPYKTFSETINLVMVTLMRELLQPQKDLSVAFTKDVQEFVKGKSFMKITKYFTFSNVNFLRDLSLRIFFFFLISLRQIWGSLNNILYSVNFPYSFHEIKCSQWIWY